MNGKIKKVTRSVSREKVAKMSPKKPSQIKTSSANRKPATQEGYGEVNYTLKRTVKKVSKLKK